MNNMQKSFKRKSALRCMADGGAVAPTIGELNADRVAHNVGQTAAEVLRQRIVDAAKQSAAISAAFQAARAVAPRVAALAGPVGVAVSLGKQLYDETRPGGMLTRPEPTLKVRYLDEAPAGLRGGRNARRMAEGGAVYKSVGTNGVPNFSDDPSSGALYSPGSPVPAPAPPQSIGPPSSLAPAPLPVPPPAAKISPLAIGPKSNLMGMTGGFGPTPAPQSTYMKAGGTGAIGSQPSSIGANRAEIGAGRAPIGAGSQPIGAMSPPIGANRAEIGANRTPIGAPRMGALGRPIMTSVGYARGGKVRGPGGPTEDKIPAMLSNGEYVLPADTVKQVGVQNLDALKDATHAPSGQSKLRGNVRKYAVGSTGGVKPLSPEEQHRLDNPQYYQPNAYAQNARAGVLPPEPAKLSVNMPAAGEQLKAKYAGIGAASAPYDPNGGIMPQPAKLIEGQKPWTQAQKTTAAREFLGVGTNPFTSAAVESIQDYDKNPGIATGAKAAGNTVLGATVGALQQGSRGLMDNVVGPFVDKAKESAEILGLRTPAAPAPAPAPTPAPGTAPALPEGVTQRPDGIYQQGNSFSNVLGPDGKPQFLPQERMGPPSPAAEAYLARTPEMQFGPVPSGPGSSLRSGRGGGMRLNMPSASDTAQRGINDRFDKMIENYRKSADPMSPSKTARTMADLEQARTNALNGVMGNDTARRGQDMDSASNAARNAAGLEQEGMRGQFALLSGQAAASLAAQKAQTEQELKFTEEDRANFDQMYGDSPDKGEAYATYAANRHLLPQGIEGVQQAGAMLGMLKAAGLAPGTRIEAFGANPVTGGAGSEESDPGTRYTAAGGGLRGIGAALNPADWLGDDNYYTIHTKAGPKKVARRSLRGGDSQMQTWQELLGRNNLE